MTSLPDPIVNPHSAGSRGGSECGLASLDPFVYREMRWCSECEAEEEFWTLAEFVAGRIGVCLGCGSRRVIPFSRVTETQ